MGLTRLQKIVYGSGRFGSTILLNIASLATFYVYLKKYNLNPVLNGIANGIGKLAIAISGVVMGYISDATVHPKLGKRKPYIISGSIFLAVSFLLLFFPEFFIDVRDQMLLFAYEAFFISAFNFAYGYLLTPYQAWMPEITEVHERSEVSGYENIFNLLGNIVGTGGSFLMPMIINNTKLLFQMLLVLSIIEIIMYIAPTVILMEPKKYLPIPKLSLKEIAIVLHDINFVYWMLAQGTLSVGLVIVITLLLPFIESLGFVGLQYLGVSMGLMLTILVAFFIWMKLPSKITVKKTMTYSLMIMVIFLLILPLRIFIPDQAIFSVIVLGAAAVGIAGYWIMVYVVQANIIEMNARATNVSRAGTYLGLNGLVLNIFQAAAYWLTGYIVKIDPNYIIWTIIAAIFIFLGALIFQKVQPDIPPEE